MAEEKACVRPYTDVLPKPLLPINKKPAIRVF